MKLKRLGMLVTTVAIVAGLAVPTFAAGRKLTFAHGINSSAQTTFGSISSSEYEDSMQIRLMVKNSGSTIIRCYTSPVLTDLQYMRLTKEVDGVKGSSYCYYYVDGVMKHQSTAWYDFDFR